MKGIIARHGYKSKRDWSKRVRKPYKYNTKIRFCIICDKPIKLPSRKYCGNKLKKTGCAFSQFKLKCLNSQRKLYSEVRTKRLAYFKKYRITHKDYFRKKRVEFIKRNPNYYKK